MLLIGVCGSERNAAGRQEADRAARQRRRQERAEREYTKRADVIAVVTTLQCVSRNFVKVNAVLRQNENRMFGNKLIKVLVG